MKINTTASLAKVIIVNRYYPPDRSPIAIAANDLALYLLEQGTEVNIVHTDGQYKGSGKKGIDSGIRHIINKVYDGNNSVLKLFGNLIEGYRLIKKAKQLHKSTGAPIIVMTNPALLNYWAGRLLNKNNIPWIYWSMDLFPEAFVATELVSSKNWIYKYLFDKVYSRPPTTILALGKIQANYLLDKYESKPNSVVLPCGTFIKNTKEQLDSSKLPDWKRNTDKIILGYVGNIGTAHSEDFLKWVIDYMDPNKHKLVLRLYGLKTELIKQYAEGKPSIEFLGFVPEEDLVHIDLHLVSLISTYVNVCVPSKMVSAVYRGALVLFHGIPECDNWDYLQDAAFLIHQNKHAQQQVKLFLEKLSRALLENKKKQAAHMPNKLLTETKAAYKELHELIIKLNK